ncbi:MAG: efflux RND transporter periplasmic adaptor subunit [Rhodospirillales bacterium]|nr:efflux RND transporter periplasmic adaptor subunit [Rhodospirillales bacterium]
MRRATQIAIGIVAAAGLWVLSGQLTGQGKNTDAAPDEVTSGAGEAIPDEQRPRVRITESTAISHSQEFTVFGRSEADRVVDIRSETSGRIVNIFVEKGMAVDTGTELVRLAMDDRQSKLTETRAQVDYRKIAFDAAQSLAKKKFSAEVTVAGDLAALETAKAALQAIRLDIARTHISVPFSGIIEESPVEIGDLVQIGDKIAQLVDLDPITISVEVSEKQISAIRIGQQSHIQFASGIIRAGAITYVSRSASNDTRTFRVEIEVPNIDHDIPQGLTAEVTLLTGSVLAHLISPAVLTLSDEGQLGVKIINDEDHVIFMPIVIVAETEEGIWVDGLDPTVRLITVGQEFVQDGQLVDAVMSEGF